MATYSKQNSLDMKKVPSQEPMLSTKGFLNKVMVEQFF